MAKVIMKEQEKSSITTLPEGTYQAIISSAWDIGMQEGEWKGQATLNHKIMFRFEINELIPDEGTFKGKRYCIFKEINIPEFFGDKSALVMLTGAAEGKAVDKEFFSDFDTDSLVGKNIMVSTGLTHPKKNAKILTFSALMKGLPLLTPELDASMPPWVEEKANTAVVNEEGAPVREQGFSAPPAPEDDLPF